MATVAEGLEAQLRNIEVATGKSIAAWVKIIAGSGKTKHTDVVAMLKAEHGLGHGTAHRLSLVSRAAGAGDAQPAPAAASADPADALYVGKKAGVRPIHDRVMAALGKLGDDIERAPKKGYLSLRRRKQFAMVQPGATYLNVGLILDSAPPTVRLESAARWNALFTHRVRVHTTAEVDRELVAWLKQAYDGAG
jgi:Domain of unknown function (DUF5655)/Domain of unknown function (DUF4287)